MTWMLADPIAQATAELQRDYDAMFRACHLAGEKLGQVKRELEKVRRERDLAVKTLLEISRTISAAAQEEAAT